MPGTEVSRRIGVNVTEITETTPKRIKWYRAHYCDYQLCDHYGIRQARPSIIYVEKERCMTGGVCNAAVKRAHSLLPAKYRLAWLSHGEEVTCEE